jgi:hypothetical protein
MPTLLSAVSILQVFDSLLAVFMSVEAMEQALEIMTSRSVRNKNPNDAIEIVRSPTFVEDIGEHLDALLPKIRESIVYQSVSVTMVDGMHRFDGCATEGATVVGFAVFRVRKGATIVGIVPMLRPAQTALKKFHRVLILHG